MGRYDGRLPMTYSAAERMLAGKDSKKVLNNTMLELAMQYNGYGNLERCYRVTYHGNVIAIFYPDGWVTFSNCGYNTVTTYARLNAMAYAYCGRKNWDAVLWDENNDAVNVNRCGNHIAWMEKHS